MRCSALSMLVWRDKNIGKRQIEFIESCKIQQQEQAVCGNPHHVRYLEKRPPGNVCVVFGCRNYSGGQSGLSFFSLPDKLMDNDRYRKFFFAAARDDLAEFTPHHRICSAHFTSPEITFQYVSILSHITLTFIQYDLMILRGLLMFIGFIKIHFVKEMF